ncbi:hypothetical protein PAHAL_1G100900 [Panicum hallii]|nr:hypothetical protein PAHAL_1G100900 [Panicum hallii]
MPSQVNYFTNLLSQEAVDVFESDDNEELENDFQEFNDMNSQPKSKGRSKNFTEQEDVLLVSAHPNVGKNAIAGRDQKDGKFWERVETYFHVNKTFESDRNWSSLRHRWSLINREINSFRGFLDKIERKNESEKIMNDKIAEAKALFLERKKKPFSIFHCWNLLKDEPKYRSRQNPDSRNANEDGPLNAQRPLGRKAEKERARKCDETESDPFIEEVKKMREAREETDRERKARDDQFLEIEKSKFDLEREQHDNLIMQTDTSTMDDEAKQYFKFMKQEILARRFGTSLQ